MRAVIALLLALVPLAASGMYDISTEYRSDSFEDEEKERVFFRGTGSVFIDERRGAGCTVIRFPEEKRGSFTWYAKAASDSGFSLLAGNFYAQAGSGLLSGRLKPYIPDPFAEEREIVQKSVFKECSGGYPDYAYQGAALSYQPSRGGGIDGLYFFGSMAPRFYSEDYGRSSDSSYSTILGNTEKEGSKYEPVFARSAGAVVSSGLFSVLRFELSGIYNDLRDGDGRPVLWSAGNDGACERTAGFSFYCAYNDGVCSAFGEYARNIQRWIDGGTTYSLNSYAWQGRGSVKTERFSLTVSGKRIADGYYLPYFSSMGKRTPSEGIFLESVICPYRLFSFRLYSSSDRNTSVSAFTPEKIPSCKESARIDITPEGKGSLFFMYRQIGDALMLPEKRQTSTGAEYRFIREFSAHADFTDQRSDHLRSRSILSGVNFFFLSVMNGSVQGGYSRVDKGDTMYQDALALDAEGASWMSVRERSWNAGARLGIALKSFSAAVRYAVQGEGKRLYHTRFECRASGRW
jgi:hypothetical protein